MAAKAHVLLVGLDPDIVDYSKSPAAAEDNLGPRCRPSAIDAASSFDKAASRYLSGL